MSVAQSRKAYCSGSYKRKLHINAAEVELNVPKLKAASFETQIIQRYRRREASAEEFLVAISVASSRF